MKLHLWGTDFRRSPADMRKKLYLPPEVRREKIQEILSLGFTDLVYLWTCNRVEFYTTAEDYFSDTRPLWIKKLAHLGISEEDYYHGYHLEGKSALRHLLRVACSLESLVVGEPQILGQLKEAVQWTKENRFPLDPSLEKAFQFAFETAKKVRSLTSIAEKPVSVATLGLRHLERLEKDYPLERAVVVGRSPICLIVIQWLKKNRPNCPILWVNRRLETLKNFLEYQDTEPMLLSDFLKNPPAFSHLFTATSSIEPVFRKEFFEKLPSKKRLVFDFAEPSDIEPGIGGDVLVTHLENLLEEAKENANARAKGIREAETIIETSLRDYFMEQKEAPLLRDFNSIEPQFLEELQRVYSLIEQEFPKELHPRLKKLAEKIVKRNLHQSREHLRLILRKIVDPGPGDYTQYL